MNPIIWLVILLITFLIVFWKQIQIAIQEHRRYVYLINKIPGPKTIPLFGNAFSLSPNSEKSTYQMEYFFRKYTEDVNSPGLMRIWLGPKPIVIVYKCEAVKVILESHSLISKPLEYNILERWLGTGLLTSTGKKWHSRRKMLTPAFHFKILANFLIIFNKQAETLIENLDKHCDDGYPFDFYKVIKALALDIICEAAMGVNIKAQSGKNFTYVSSAIKLCELSFLRMRSPWLWPNFIWYLTGKGYLYDKSLKSVKDFTKSVISKRKINFLKEKELEKQHQNNDRNDNCEIESKNKTMLEQNRLASTANIPLEKKRLAFLDLLINLQHEENQLTDEDIREEVDTFMFEENSKNLGHDTVSSSMGFFTFSVAHRPQIQNEIYNEMLEIFGDDEERDITIDDISKMKYLDQCIKEAMRLLPTVPIIGRLITEETNINGFIIPKNITALIAPFAVQRDKRFYHNPDSFDPNHFKFEHTHSRNPYSYIPFSAGPRNCIGQKFASTVQRVVLAKIFRRYRFVPQQHEFESRGLPELVLKPSHGFIVRVERRKNI